MLPEALLHLLPFQHGEQAEPFVVLGLVLAGVAAAVFAGIWASNVALARPRLGAYAAAFSAGALLFLFFDLVKEAASLGQGLVRSPLLQAGLVAAFALGALAIPALARDPATPSRLAWLWALGIAAHGAGEGWIIGTEADAAGVGAPLGMLSFLLHKGIEGATIPVVAGAVLGTRTAVALALLLGGLAALSGLAGLRLGPGQAPLLLFAAGAGASAYAILRLGSATRPSVGQVAALVVGVLAVYGAGMLHEF